MRYGFSYMGFLFVVLLLGPSFYWVNLPGYKDYQARKSGIFQGIERIGLTFSSCVALIFQNYNYQGLHPWLIFLLLAWICLAAYEFHWIFCRKKMLLPRRIRQLPLTALSPLALLFLGIYGRSLWLMAAALIYGIGHVGGTVQDPETDWHCSCCSDSCDL